MLHAREDYGFIKHVFGRSVGMRLVGKFLD
jgi:hypothetical protein